VTLQPYGADRAANLWLDESDGRWYPPEAHPDYHPPEPWIGVTSRQTSPSPAGQRLVRWLRPRRHGSALETSPDPGTTAVVDIGRECSRSPNSSETFDGPNLTVKAPGPRKSGSRWRLTLEPLSKVRSSRLASRRSSASR
jgi:hypothetical protein